MGKMYRQGDVLIVEVEEIPEKAVRAPHCVVAHGEATGHTHRFEVGAQQFINQVNEQLQEQYIEVLLPQADLLHQEHDTIQIPKGKYKIVHQREYTPQGLRNVLD